MNTAQDEACSVSKSAVMDCKLTSPGLMFLTCFVFVWPGRYRLFSLSSNTSGATIASRSTKVSGGRLVAVAFRLGSSWNPTFRRTVGKATNCRVVIANSPADSRRPRPSRSRPSRLSSGSSHTIIVYQPGVIARARGSGRNAMNIIFSIIREDTFWKILLFVHFLLAVSLLAAVTLQAVAVLMPARQMAGGFIDRNPVPAASYAALIAVVYVLQALMGAWIYIKYRTYVRIPMEQLRHFWTVGSFELKEHVVTMGMGLLPAYWYFWRQPLSAEHDNVRRWVTVFLAISVWYAFIVGHVANDFRGVGS